MHMKMPFHRGQWRQPTVLIGGAVIAVTVVAIATLLSTSSTHAEFVSGNPGTASGASGDYWTTKGHGWKLYDVSDATGPSGGFYSGYWGNVDDKNSVAGKCNAAGSNKVWVYVVRNSSGGEKSFTFQNTYEYYKDNFNPDNNNGGAAKYPSKGWWIDRPGAGGDPYEYNADGVHDGSARYGGASGYGTADEVVRSVRAKYEGAGGDRASWGWSVGWFCWSDNPPWSVTVTTARDREYAEPGETITWTHTIKNNGANQTNVDITWRADNEQGLGTGTAESWKFTARKAKDAKDSKTSTYLVKPSDYGKNLCRYTYAEPAKNTGGSTKSDEQCVLIIKRPKVHVLGGDVRANSVDTAVSYRDGKYYGSWVEYGIASKGLVTGMASGSGFAGGRTTGDLCAVSYLTFGNNRTDDSSKCDSKQIGKYSTSSSQASALAARFSADRATDLKTPTSTDIKTLDSTKVYTSKDAVHLTSSEKIPKGKWVVIHVPDNTVYIDQNIEYATGALKTIRDIPQVIIIAKNIIIKDSVTSVDAWLVGRGTGNDGMLVTCGAVSKMADLRGANCNKNLTINGPVMVNRLLLYRTFGAESGATIAQPAESFNLRADAYLWAKSLDVNNRAETTSIIEVPPRF